MGPQATHRPLPHHSLAHPTPPYALSLLGLPNVSCLMPLISCSATFTFSTPSWPLWWAPLLAKCFASFTSFYCPSPLSHSWGPLPHPNPSPALPQQLLPAPPLPLGFHDNLVGHSVLSPPLTALLLFCLRFSSCAPPPPHSDLSLFLPQHLC